MIPKSKILIVDDMKINRVLLSNPFSSKYEVIEACNGLEALKIIEEQKDSIAIVLLDIMMPEIDGYTVLKEMKARGYLNTIPVIVVTTYDSIENEAGAFDLGASDIIAKPFEPSIIRRRVNNLVELNERRLMQDELIKQQAEQIARISDSMVESLSNVVEFRSEETGQHIKRVRIFTNILLNELSLIHPEYGLDEKTISTITSASALHDVGKVAIPDAIINKPGKLTKEEFDIMKEHSHKGSVMVQGFKCISDENFLNIAYEITRYHHEKWDGKGYPDGLKGEEIPISAQVVSIADCYDALTTKRVYKDAYSPEQAFNMICNGECGAFNPKILDCFTRLKGTFEQVVYKYSD